MGENYTDEQELALLEQKINQAQASGKPIKQYVLRQIEILQNAIDIFHKQMAQENRAEDVQVAEIEIRHYAMMRELAKKINEPTKKYDDAIKNIRIKIFGAENYKLFFKDS